MKNKCVLPKELASCRYYLDGFCNNPDPNNRCGMLDPTGNYSSMSEYKREDRWYEKYYKGISKRI